MPYKDLKDIQYAELGKIIHIHGLRGHVIAHIEPDVTTLDSVKYIFIKIGTTLVPYQVEESSLRDHQALVKFQGVEDKTAALELIHKSIWLPEEIFNEIVDMPESYEDVVGYYVIDIHQGSLGTVERIEQFSMNRCLVVNYLNKELLIPYVPTFIHQLDHKNKQLIVQLPPGFLAAVGCK